MTNATTSKARNSSSSVSVWFKRAIAGGLLACGPALVSLATAPASLAAPADQTPSVVAHHTQTHVPNGAVKHHHHHHGSNVRTGGDE